MQDKKVTDIMLDRIKYFINAIENGEYNPIGYKFTVSLQLPSASLTTRQIKEVSFSDDNLKEI